MNNVGSRAVRTLAVLAVTTWLIGLPAPALAQAAAPSTPVGGLGYGFVGFGAATGGGDSTATYHVGGGGEAVFRDAIGVGAEIGYVNVFGEDADGIGVLSINGTYHFGGGKAPAKARPFLTGGYTLGFNGGESESLFNVGVGVDYWFKPKVGLRIEFRDHIWTSDNETIQFWGVRFGVTFR